MADPSPLIALTSGTLTPLYIFGASSQGLVVAEAAVASRQYAVMGFIDDNAPSPDDGSQPTHSLWPVFKREQIDASASHRLIIAVGDNAARARLTHEMSDAGWIMTTIVHPTAWISPSATIGLGIYVGPQAAINAQAHIEDGVIINTGAIVEHHCNVARFAHLCPRTALAGHVTIGQMTMVGTGASVCPRINIGRDCVIGAGAAVAHDIEDGRLAMGVPAKCRPFL